MEFINLKKQYQKIKPSVQKRINAVLENANYIMGSEIAELEQKLSQFVGTNYCITCSSGTDALLLPLLAMGVGPGDAVFTSTFTFVATAEVIALLGATPVFVDIDPKTYNIDVLKLRQEIIKVKTGYQITDGSPLKLTPKAIIPVDLFGHCADYNSINAISKEFNLFVIEDAAQSFGGDYQGKKACSFGDMAATSFFPAKPLGCYGDGGAIFFNDANMVETLKSLRVHGQGADKYETVRIGINGRMDTIQAAVLLAKMEIIEKEIELRQTVASRYTLALQKKFVTPSVLPGYRSAWAQYSIQSENRDRIMTSLKNLGIPVAIYYLKPLHLQKAFGFLRYEKGHCPVAEEIAEKIFSIPMHPYLEEKEQDQVIEALLKY